MIRWVGTRLLAAMATMLVAAIVIFASLKLIPGDPLAAITAGTRLTPEQRETMREHLGLNQDFVSGFFTWLSGIVRFDFGQSLVYGTSVNDLIASRLPQTVALVVVAAIISISVSLVIGLVSALRPGWVDKVGLVITSVSIALPSFVTALLLISVFAVRLGAFPATGSGTGFVDMMYHLTLPAITLALVTFGLLARVARASFRAQLASEHVEVARSRGVARGAIIWRHVIRNSFGPIATLVALLVAGLFVGTTIVETAFGIEGVGNLLIWAIGRRDFPIVQALSLLSVGLFVALSTVVDLLMPLIDPQVRKVASSA